jgi:recombination protein RecA
MASQAIPRSLAAYAAKVQSKYGAQRVSNAGAHVIIPTGSAYLDWALRVGGWMDGRVYEIFGAKDSGKSSLAISSMIQFQRLVPDRGVAYINMENTFDEERAAAMGLDCSDEAKAAGRWFPMLPEHSEHVSDMARDLVGDGFCSVVVVDSIGAMESDKVLGAKTTAEDAAKSVGRNAKIITQMSKALSRLARLNRCTVLLINQPRAPIGGMAGSPDVSAGPKFIQHFTTAKITMSAVYEGDAARKLLLPGEEADLMVSIKARMRVDRLKNGLPGRTAEAYINRVGTDEYGLPGFDAGDEYLTLGTRHGVIKTGGAYYTFPDGTKIQGKAAAAARVRGSLDDQKMIREALAFEAPVPELEGAE